MPPGGVYRKCSDSQTHLRACAAADAGSWSSPPGSPITPQVHLAPTASAPPPTHFASRAVKRHDMMLLLQYFISQRGCSIWKITIETDHLSPALPGCVGGTKIGCCPSPPCRRSVCPRHAATHPTETKERPRAAIRKSTKGLFLILV